MKVLDVLSLYPLILGGTAFAFFVVGKNQLSLVSCSLLDSLFLAYTHDLLYVLYFSLYLPHPGITKIVVNVLLTIPRNTIVVVDEGVGIATDPRQSA